MLGPLSGKPAAAWHTAPPGMWTPGQIVAHVTVAIDRSAAGFESRADHPPMMRRPAGLPVSLARRLVLATGWIPPGRKAPEGTAPPPQPDRSETEALLRRGIERFLELERRLLPRRSHDLYLRHPVLGDLTLTEFMRFHVVHGAHHQRQIVRRLGG